MVCGNCLQVCSSKARSQLHTEQMGRTRIKKRVSNKTTDSPAQLKSKSASSTSSTAPSIPSLLEKAEALIEQCDYELSLRFIRRILEREPGNAVAREMMGVALLETGELEEAKEVLSSLHQ